MKKISIRATALLMIAVILSCVFPLPIVASTTDDTAHSISQKFTESNTVATTPPYDYVIPNEAYTGEDRIIEIASRRDEYTKHFLMPDGTASAIVYAEPIHRQGASGEWLDYDNSVAPKRAGQKEVYATADSRLTFAKAATQDVPALTLAESGYRISLSFADSFGTTRAASNSTTALVTNAPTTKFSFSTLEEAVSSVSASTTVRYSEAYPKTDVEYVSRGSSVKENIIIKERLSAYSYSFLLSLEGLVATLEKNGAITLSDRKTGAIQYVLPNPYMYDAKGGASTAVTYSLQTVGDGVYRLTVTADAEWINAPERAFPVTVDPTITVNSGFADTFLNAAAGGTNYGGWTAIWVDATYTGLVKFPLPSLPTGSTVTMARLHMYYGYYIGVSGSRTIGVYRMNAAWGENTVTYNILYNTYGAGLGSATTPMITVSAPTTSTSMSFSILSAVQAWYSGTPNNGLMLKNGTESLSAEPGVGYLSTIFTSGEAVTDTPMYAEIRYTDPRVNNRVYYIKNVQTGKYLTVQNGGTAAGTALILSEGTSTDNPNRAQLFKITYYQTTAPLGQGMNYYSIRSMTNSALALDAPYTASGGVTLQEKSPSDTASLALTQCWGITPRGTTSDGDVIYLLKNGPETYESYLSAATGTQVLTGSTVTESSQWVLVPYTGEALGGIDFYSNPRKIMRGETVSYAATMYSSIIGTNGPVLYSVADPESDSTTKATINESGVLTALEAGTVVVKWTYENAPWIWYAYVDIGFEDGIVYTFRHTSSDTLMLESTSTATLSAEAYNTNNATSMWKTEYHSSGYYKIKNDVTGHYLSAANVSPYGLHIGTDAGDNSLFKIERVDGGYRIKSKWQHENASSPRYVTVSGGGLTQSYATSSTSHVWDIKPLKLNLNVKYDPAFVERRGANTYRQLLTDIFLTEGENGVSIESVLKERFGIKLCLNIATTTFASYPYTCDCLLIDDLDTLCYNHWPPPMLKNCGDESNLLLTQEERTKDCAAGLHHKNSSKMLDAVPKGPLPASQYCDMFFTGFITCYINQTGCAVDGALGLAGPNTTAAMVFNQHSEMIQVRRTTCHELLHLLGTPDHSKNQIEYGLPCIYGGEMMKPSVMGGLLLCETCLNAVQANKLKLYYHQ